MWPWKEKSESSRPAEDDYWRIWSEQLPKFQHLEPIARELCAEFGMDPDKPVAGDDRQLNWHYQASELEALQQRISALRRAGLLD